MGVVKELKCCLRLSAMEMCGGWCERVKVLP